MPRHRWSRYQRTWPVGSGVGPPEVLARSFGGPADLGRSSAPCHVFDLCHCTWSSVQSLVSAQSVPGCEQKYNIPHSGGNSAVMEGQQGGDTEGLGALSGKRRG